MHIQKRVACAYEGGSNFYDVSSAALDVVQVYRDAVMVESALIDVEEAVEPGTDQYKELNRHLMATVYAAVACADYWRQCGNRPGDRIYIEAEARALPDDLFRQIISLPTCLIEAMKAGLRPEG